jgi:hypothetical protein
MEIYISHSNVLIIRANILEGYIDQAESMCYSGVRRLVAVLLLGKSLLHSSEGRCINDKYVKPYPYER